MNTCLDRAVLQQKLDMIAEALRPLTTRGVLYGSQVLRPSLDRDIDVFVISEKESVDRIFQMVAHLQMMFSQVVHVVVLSEPDLERNPSWLALLEHGTVLWEGCSDSKQSPCDEDIWDKRGLS